MCTDDNDDDCVECFSGKKADGGMQSVIRATTLRPLHCVWAKCRGFPWYPGMVRCFCFAWFLCDMLPFAMELKCYLVVIDNLLLWHVEAETLAVVLAC